MIPSDLMMDETKRLPDSVTSGFHCCLATNPQNNFSEEQSAPLQAAQAFSLVWGFLARRCCRSPPSWRGEVTPSWWHHIATPFFPAVWSSSSCSQPLCHFCPTWSEHFCFLWSAAKPRALWILNNKDPVYQCRSYTGHLYERAPKLQTFVTCMNR